MYYGLGSSMGGCGVPSDRDRYYVADPTGGRSQFLGASGNRINGFTNSEARKVAEMINGNARENNNRRF